MNEYLFMKMMHKGEVFLVNLYLIIYITYGL